MQSKNTYDRVAGVTDWKTKVEAALEKYKNGDSSEGFNILRYAQQRRLNIDDPEFAQKFVAWYPSDPAYLILRLAKAGKLQYREV